MVRRRSGVRFPSPAPREPAVSSSRNRRPSLGQTVSRDSIVDGRPCSPPVGAHLCYAREMGAAGSAVVGRDQEVATLLDFLETPGALPAALVFEGEAGIGKTTLWRAGLEHAIAHSYRVLSCRPSGAETALSFAGLGDLVEPVLDDILIELPNPQRRALVVALLLEDADGPPPDHRAIALAFLGVARALCRAGPVAIAVDDVQWLDPPSAFVLGFALRRMRDEPIAFLFAVRAGEADVLDLDRALPEERVQRLVVGPLSLGALQRLLKDRLGLVLSRPKLRRVHELSGGNPFFALELGRAFKRGGVRLEPGESLPSRLAALVDDRLVALPADTRAALLVASALSRPTIELVGRAGIGEPGERLAPALEANVIEFEDDRIRFSHPLLASGVYAAARPSERRALHRRLADAVPDPEERARHLALAAEGPHPDVASALEEAATRAHSRGALAAAAELSLQARQLTPLDHADERHRRAIQAAAYAFESGESSRARALLEETLTSSPAGPPRALALYWLGCLEEYEGDRHVAVELYRQALAEAGDDLAMCSMLEDGIAVALFLMREDLTAAAAHARAAVAFADRIGDASAKMMALGNQGLIDAVLGRKEGRTALERGVELERTQEPGRGVVGTRLAAAPSMLIATELTWSDEIESARSTLTSVRDRAYDRAKRARCRGSS